MEIPKGWRLVRAGQLKHGDKFFDISSESWVQVDAVAGFSVRGLDVIRERKRAVRRTKWQMFGARLWKKVKACYRYF